MTDIRILIVEDENIVGLEIKKRLKKLGYSVHAVAKTGEEAIIKTAATSPDIILMDIMLKGEMDGIETARQIKNQHNIPIIYLTAYSDEETISRAKETNPHGYILKPFQEDDMKITIEMALHKHRMNMDRKTEQA
ncbi:response regulator receiver protein [Methanosalsum zhilinae DSM 4017]|uniref:Response regulator receiver protein n=1 Tax=Methanosalsum zhilinae (strain DSM 4017 / NBRC 107636 / OCM 62 / WeN5) TaxID=679901 RepID=F7XP75_METZD|nr:response regulator [Methanosalsum zhilinae]AEH61369.1 response regulator receiver protein [Methanosalsum zhilinae DSM 4017]